MEKIQLDEATRLQIIAMFERIEAKAIDLGKQIKALRKELNDNESVIKELDITIEKAA